MIEVQCNGHQCSAYTEDAITTWSKGIPVHFVFSEEWAGLKKTAVFRVGAIQTDVPLDGNTLFLPQSILLCPGQLTVGVYGTNETGSKRIASTLALVGRVQPGTGDMFHRQGADTPEKHSVHRETR